MFLWGESPILNNLIGKPFSEVPCKIQHLKGQNISLICFNENNAVVLLQDGSVHTFNFGTGNGQLQANSRVVALETVHIVYINAGGGHILAIDDGGKVYAWGQNNKGQLGWVENLIYSSPKLVKSLKSQYIVSVACGAEHSLFLASDGIIWSSGNNNYGQLGIGSTTASNINQITSLVGIPFLQIVAGYWHSFAVTISGAVFGWGRNDMGQLGIGDTQTSVQMSPVLLKSLRTQSVKYVSAGELHTCALTLDGGVFTFGSNESGQLGHGASINSAFSPKKVFELMGNQVTQIACGKSHTLAFVPSPSPQVYSFGDNSSGQLGNSISGSNKNPGFLPQLVHGPWQKRIRPSNNDINTFIHGTSFSSSLEVIKQINCGWNVSAATTTVNNEDTFNFRNKVNHKGIFELTAEHISKLEHLAKDTKVAPDVKKYLETIMTSQTCLNCSFLDTDHYKTSSNYSGIRMTSVRLAFSKLSRCECENVQEIVKSSVQQLIPKLSNNPPDIEALRIFLFLPECPLFTDANNYSNITIPFAYKCLNLPAGAAKVLDRWYRGMEKIEFLRPIEIYKETVLSALQRPPMLFHDASTQTNLKIALDFLGRLNRVNNMEDKLVLPFQRFYLPDLAGSINLEDDYVRWLSGNNRFVVFCHYPFLLNSKAKSTLLQIDATWQMRAAYSEAQDRNMQSLFVYSGENMIETPVLELEVRRDNLVHDTLPYLANQVDMRSLKKPLLIKFKGEEGQDVGGVRKEFFMLILKEVIDPKYGMFRYFEDSRLMWFSNFELETDAMYFLVGILCGLAIYNNTIIDICFPLALYKKLLGEKPNINDLKELDPVVFQNMQKLMDFGEGGETGDIEDVFCLDFTINRENFGEVITEELVPNGAKIFVSKENRKEYVDAYLNYLFNTSVHHQFESFNKGFHKVCGGRIMKLFRPTELMEMVVGNQNYNWEDFEKSADYKGEYYRNHPVIKLFWEVFHAFSLEEKREFLLFLTGCTKVPINGVKITIQPVRSSTEYLPVAHTCFNLLDLPMYSSKEMLHQKLTQAMLYNQGFHLV